MKTSITLRPAQSSAAPRFTSAALRALLLGGLAVLSSAGAAFAQDAPAVKTKQADAQSLAMTVENPAKQRMHLQVYSLQKRANLAEVANRNLSYGTTLNFKGVEPGKYAVLLRVGRERYRYNVQVSKQPEAPIMVQGLTPAQAPTLVASTTR